MSNADWWAQKLNGTQNQGQQFRPDPTPPMPPSQQPMTPMPTLHSLPLLDVRKAHSKFKLVLNADLATT
jgi:hypothetical protein